MTMYEEMIWRNQYVVWYVIYEEIISNDDWNDECIYAIINDIEIPMKKVMKWNMKLMIMISNLYDEMKMKRRGNDDNMK